jgi:hypothetical protein
MVLEGLWDVLGLLVHQSAALVVLVVALSLPGGPGPWASISISFAFRVELAC